MFSNDFFYFVFQFLFYTFPFAFLIAFFRSVFHVLENDKKECEEAIKNLKKRS